MRYSLYIFIIPVVLIAPFLFYSGAFGSRQKLPAERVEQPTQTGTATGQWETKTDDQPPVTIRVTPVELGKDAKTWKFQIVFDTHSGNLDDDVLVAATLANDKGNVYKSTAWEGPGPGGHHREGILIFNTINPLPPFVELKIKNVGGVTERSFKWSF